MFTTTSKVKLGSSFFSPWTIYRSKTVKIKVIKSQSELFTQRGIPSFLGIPYRVHTIHLQYKGNRSDKDNTVVRCVNSLSVQGVLSRWDPTRSAESF